MGNNSSGGSRSMISDTFESRYEKRRIDRLKIQEKRKYVEDKLQAITRVAINIGYRIEAFERDILLEKERFTVDITRKLQSIKLIQKNLKQLDEFLSSIYEKEIRLDETQMPVISTSTVSGNISGLRTPNEALAKAHEEKLYCQEESSSLQLEIDDIKAQHQTIIKRMRTELLSYVAEEQQIVSEKKQLEEHLAQIDAELKFKLYTSDNTISLYQEEHQKSMEIFLHHIDENSSKGDIDIEYPRCFSERYINDMELNWLYVVAAAFSQDPAWILEEKNYIFLLTQAFFSYWCRGKLGLFNKDSGDLANQIGEEVMPVISKILKKLKPKAWDMLFDKTVRISSARMFGERAFTTLSDTIIEASSITTTMLQSGLVVDFNQLRQIILRYTETESKVSNMLDLLNRSIDYKISMSTFLTQECENWWTGERVDSAIAKIDEDRQKVATCLQKMTISREEIDEFNLDLSEEERICFEEVDYCIKVGQSLPLSDSTDIDLSNLLKLATDLKDIDSSSAVVAYTK